MALINFDKKISTTFEISISADMIKTQNDSHFIMIHES